MQLVSAYKLNDDGSRRDYTGRVVGRLLNNEWEGSGCGLILNINPTFTRRS
jgi:hypothetical protein